MDPPVKPEGDAGRVCPHDDGSRYPAAGAS